MRDTGSSITGIDFVFFAKQDGIGLMGLSAIQHQSVIGIFSK